VYVFFLNFVGTNYLRYLDFELYSSASIIRIIKSRRMRWVGHVARMGEKRNACRILVGKPEGKRPLGIGWIWLRIGTSGGLL
jgi:hypothetical protein